MKRTHRLGLLAIALSSTIAFVGCSKEGTTDKPAAPATTGETASDAKDSEDEFAGLPAADRAAALAQKLCPVTDEPLGSMGTPIKVPIEGRDVYLCCEGCVEELKSNPDKYLAKLDAAPSSDASAAPEADTAPDGDANDSDANEG